MSEKVIVTGAPMGQVVIHHGQKIAPGGRYVMDKRDADQYGNNIIILEKKIEALEVPKPAVRETPADVLKKAAEPDLDAKAAVAEMGRMDRGSQSRKFKDK